VYQPVQLRRHNLRTRSWGSALDWT